MWLSPVQVMVLPISEENNAYAKKVFEDLFKEGIKCEVDLKNQKINYKIREHSLSKVPILLILGKKEEKSQSVTVRKLGVEKQITLKKSKFLKDMQNSNKLPLN